MSAMALLFVGNVAAGKGGTKPPKPPTHSLKTPRASKDSQNAHEFYGHQIQHHEAEHQKALGAFAKLAAKPSDSKTDTDLLNQKKRHLAAQRHADITGFYKTQRSISSPAKTLSYDEQKALREQALDHAAEKAYNRTV